MRNLTSLSRWNVVYGLTTIGDLSVVRNTVFDAVYLKNGLLPSKGTNYHDIHYILYRLLLNPNPELCAVVNNYTSSFSSSYVIGFQLRVGGKMRNRMDNTFKSPEAVNLTIDGVKEHIRRLNGKQNVTVFVSTDSDSTLQLIRTRLAPTPVVSVAEYMIGHSASRHARNYTEWIASTKRAIVDMMILKECDHLVTTRGSSYGGTAIDLQQSYGMEVEVDSFLKQRGLVCSVFHRTKPVGSYEVV